MPATGEESEMSEYADIGAIRSWADGVMARQPDYIIGGNYMRRWWVVPRNAWCNVYLHHILRSDDDRAFHDHPWDNMSLVIAGRYVEHTPGGAFFRNPGDVVSRKAGDAHRLEILEGEDAVSLFQTGPKVREWGFHCPQGWRHWEEFCALGDSSRVGKGCAP